MGKERVGPGDKTMDALHRAARNTMELTRRTVFSPETRQLVLDAVKATRIALNAVKKELGDGTAKKLEKIPGYIGPKTIEKPSTRGEACATKMQLAQPMPDSIAVSSGSGVLLALPGAGPPGPPGPPGGPSAGPVGQGGGRGRRRRRRRHRIVYESESDDDSQEPEEVD